MHSIDKLQHGSRRIRLAASPMVRWARCAESARWSGAAAPPRGSQVFAGIAHCGRAPGCTEQTRTSASESGAFAEASRAGDRCGTRAASRHRHHPYPCRRPQRQMHSDRCRRARWRALHNWALRSLFRESRRCQRIRISPPSTVHPQPISACQTALTDEDDRALRPRRSNTTEAANELLCSGTKAQGRGAPSASVIIDRRRLLEAISVGLWTPLGHGG
ncbi:hypothetical protein OH77DRAFT_850242 [Trametes cingulata]|nr:hypothetical protein OH77DRAFT_850242 [Trametes cingulata]